MTAAATSDTHPVHELVLTRIIDASPEKVFRAWTQPDLLKQWFAPKPWTTPEARLDVRPGGSNLVVMRSPEGSEFPHRDIYLEVVPNEKLVVTDAYMEAWVPSEKPFMTLILTSRTWAGRRNTPPARGTGAPRIARPMRRWAFTKAGAAARTSLRRS